MEFIEINGSILDFSVYREDVSALRFEISYEMKECLSKYGFEPKKRKFKSYNRLELLFVNRCLGIEAKIIVKGGVSIKDNTNCKK